MNKDHPRLSGEKRFADNHRQRGTGSPPPMRGKGHTAIFQIKTDGITPAYAGKRGIYQSRVCSRQDHPRLCGEKQLRSCTGVCDMRITPAYAGKSFLCVFQSITEQDHPRLCGEKPVPARFPEMLQGSPPPMRGKVSCLLSCCIRR